MDGYFVGGWLAGAMVAFALFFSLGIRRRARVPSFAWWFSISVGFITCLYCELHSAAPSFAQPITVIGKAYNCVEHRVGKGHKFSFTACPQDGGSLAIETRIALPGWKSPADFDGRTLRIAYLPDRDRNPSNEAIDVAILSGKHEGWRDSLDARPFGRWLGVPIGGAVAALGMLGLRYRKDDIRNASSTDASQ